MPDLPAAERTEQPTSRRLQKARDKGNVPQSQELVSVVMLLSLIGILAILSRWLGNWAASLTREGLTCRTQIFTNSDTFISFINTKVVDSIFISIPLFAAMAGGAILATLAISGPNFAPEAINLRFDVINPTSGLQQLFNSKNMFKLLVSILKLILISIIVWIYLSDQVNRIMNLRWAWSGQIIATIAAIIFGLSIRVCGALLVLALADTLYQKWKYIEELKMTRQEIKQELKDTEGSPEVKVRIRRIQIQMSMKRMLQDVPKARVVLVNPTHVAVAIKYDPPQTEAPIVLAKGADHLAEKIMEIARAYGVPIIRRPELARTIFSTVQIGQPIPQDLYVAVAEVLAMLLRLKRRKR
jgi:flagellar biosynthetic protein FlhB